MNYLKKNKNSVVVITLVLFIIGALIFLWIQKNQEIEANDIDANVYPITLNVGDSLIFEDRTKGIESIKWDFGDSNISNQEKGVHFFQKPGYYQVTVIVNNRLTKTFPVLVSAPIENTKDITEETVIDAPSQAMQHENIVFRVHSGSAKKFTWRFGETSNIDATGELVIYSYKTPGDYFVTVFTDDQDNPIIHNIKILESYKEPDPIIVEEKEDPLIKITNDFKLRLQKIAKGEDFNQNYNYLISQYLCNKDNIEVIINGNKKNNFYYYTTGLQFDKNNVINELKLTLDENQNCIIKIEITQNK